MFGKLECRVVCFPFVLERDALLLERDAGNVFLVEELGVAKMRMLESSLGLADQMIDLRRGDTRDLVFDCAQSARADRQLSFAIERKQPALAFDLDFARQRRDGDDSVVIFAQRKTAKRLHAFVHADVKLAIAFNAHSKRMLPTQRLFGLHRRECHWTCSVENVIGNVGRTFPKLGFFYLRSY